MDHNEEWDPTGKSLEVRAVCDIYRVQKKATKMIPGMEDMKYTDHLREVNPPPLRHRRRRGDMIQVYKIISGMD